jgi:uncharacterized membrane protein
MFEWLTATTAGKFISTFFISMLPIVELRLGLPYGIALGLDYPLALTAALVGNMIPVPFIIVYIRRVFVWLRKHFQRMDSFITRLENKAHLKGETVKKYGPIGLLLFVAIPIPGTGAWTGSLIAALLDMRLKNSVPCIFLGVCIAASIMSLVTFGVISVI